jgi:hypothetical protein
MHTSLPRFSVPSGRAIRSLRLQWWNWDTEQAKPYPEEGNHCEIPQAQRQQQEQNYRSSREKDYWGKEDKDHLSQRSHIYPLRLHH